ncbi:MAG: hypothetical protein FJ012_07925 [Chloroflexi bacterium]|nr:hypothetical protein [Chloroflexota bacterium]
MSDVQVPQQLRLPLFPDEGAEVERLVNAAIEGLVLPPAWREHAVQMAQIGGRDWLVGWLACLPINWEAALDKP